MLNVIFHDTYAVYHASRTNGTAVQAVYICQKHCTRLVERGELCSYAHSQVSVPNASPVTRMLAIHKMQLSNRLVNKVCNDIESRNHASIELVNLIV